MIFRLALVFAFLLFGCRENHPRLVIARELKGINGEAYYYFNGEGLVENVVQKQHANKWQYSVEISKDTLQRGEVFRAHFIAHTDTFRVYIDEPRKEFVLGLHTPKKEPYMHVVQSFEFKTTSGGIFNLKGRIEFDTTSVPFDYKFLVR